MILFVWIWFVWILGAVAGFQAMPLMNPRVFVPISETVRRRMTKDKDLERELRDEAEILLSKARQLRQEIGEIDEKRESPDLLGSTGTTVIGTVSYPWLVETQDEGESYRLYIDIGREDGTWMDPRWAASGRRIRFTLDVKFLTKVASEEMASKMVKDNYMGKSSKVCVLATANEARLRDGFDKMNCHEGCYRIDSAGGKDTVRFYVEVDGTTQEQAFGDVSVPAGRLYFSLPCFGGSVRHLSNKEGVVTVRQFGWNTGWRREESRIVGTFHASPMETARKRDTF